jgi:hypothetical protein
MYARITNLTVYPDRIDEMVGRMEEVQGQVAQIPGLLYWFTTSNRETGESVGIAIYDSEESAAAAAGTARELLASFGEYFLKPPEVIEQGVDGFVTNA